jgi:predicted transcriptional regulator
MDVILSIKPKYVEAIMRGEKKFEFRKNIFKGKKIDYIYIYASSPIKRIVGYFRMHKVIEDQPENLWNRFKDVSGINNDEFFKYFADSRKGFAIEIADLEKFKNPVDPKRAIPGFIPPQSFCYLETSLLPKSKNHSRNTIQKNSMCKVSKNSNHSYQETLPTYSINFQE